LELFENLNDIFYTDLNKRYQRIRVVFMHMHTVHKPQYSLQDHTNYINTMARGY
jgi:hypothetical protein